MGRRFWKEFGYVCWILSHENFESVRGVPSRSRLGSPVPLSPLVYGQRRELICVCETAMQDDIRHPTTTSLLGAINNFIDPVTFWRAGQWVHDVLSQLQLKLFLNSLALRPAVHVLAVADDPRGRSDASGLGAVMRRWRQKIRSVKKFLCEPVARDL